MRCCHRKKGFKIEYRKDFTGKKRKKIKRVCLACGGEFETTFPNKLTCDEVCRKRKSRMSQNVT